MLPRSWAFWDVGLSCGESRGGFWKLPVLHVVPRLWVTQAAPPCLQQQMPNQKNKNKESLISAPKETLLPEMKVTPLPKFCPCRGAGGQGRVLGLAPGTPRAPPIGFQGPGHPRPAEGEHPDIVLNWLPEVGSGHLDTCWGQLCAMLTPIPRKSRELSAP